MNHLHRAVVSGPAPHPTHPVSLGATCLGQDRCRFLVWAPKAQRVAVKLVADAPRLLPMAPQQRGYFELTAEGIPPGSRYFYQLDGPRDLPDPASRFQPEGVHGPSEVVDPDFDWHDEAWHGLPLEQYIAYELHVGTFSSEGTFDGVAEGLDELVELGITAVELMPVAQFSGDRNWGYDGVHPFAVQNSYGGPRGLKRLIDACHQRGLAVVMDVVYNHLGPEGNYLGEFGHYFTPRYRTPWGQAVNFDDHGSDEVRRFCIENALYWLDEFHVDALRLDAVHAIYDSSARPFLQELATAVRIEGRRTNRQVFAIAETSRNDARLVRRVEQGGNGVDAQWCDDLHHALRTALTGERRGYYADYRGFSDVAKAYRDGYVLDGRYSEFRGRRHGNSARDIEPFRLVVCTQNHDQVGNRMLGERLSELASFEQQKLAAGVVLLSPFQPLLFMGEEYGEPARFQYFVSHLDPDLVQAVRQGRREEFAQFEWTEEPPDPAAEATFQRSKLNRRLRLEGRHRVLWEFYRELIRLRKTHAALALADRERMQAAVLEPDRVLAVRRWAADGEFVILFHFGSQTFTASVPLTSGAWMTVLDSAGRSWAGPGSDLSEQMESRGEVTLALAPHTVTVLMKEKAQRDPDPGVE